MTEQARTKGRLLDQAELVVRDAIAKQINQKRLSHTFITVLALLEDKRKVLRQKYGRPDTEEDLLMEIYAEFPGLHQVMEQFIYG